MSPDELARRLGEVRWSPGPGVGADRLARLVAAARAALATHPMPRKAGRRKVLYALALDGSAPDHLLKVQRYAGAPLARRLGSGAARAELAQATRFAARGLPTPLPLAAGALRRRGLLEATLLLVPIVPGAVDLGDGGRAPAAQRRDAARALGALVRAMHDAGVDQDDLAPNNFLWRAGATPELLAIDFERVRLRRRVAPVRRARALAKLDRHLAGASAADRLRLLHGYSAGDRAAAHRWWRAVASQQGWLARRDLAHLLRTATRASRRFVPIADGATRGWARRGASVADAVAALDSPPREGPLTVRGLGRLDERAAARAWAAALVLAARAAAPPPVALLRRSGEAFLVAELPPGAVRFAPGSPRTALRPLLDRLLAIGFAAEALTLDDVALVRGPRGGWRAVVLDPRGLRPGLAARAGGARAWAQRLLGASAPEPPDAR